MPPTLRQKKLGYTTRRQRPAATVKGSDTGKQAVKDTDTVTTRRSTRTKRQLKLDVVVLPTPASKPGATKAGSKRRARPEEAEVTADTAVLDEDRSPAKAPRNSATDPDIPKTDDANDNKSNDAKGNVIQVIGDYEIHRHDGPTAELVDGEGVLEVDAAPLAKVRGPVWPKPPVPPQSKSRRGTSVNPVTPTSDKPKALPASHPSRRNSSARARQLLALSQGEAPQFDTGVPEKIPASPQRSPKTNPMRHAKKCVFCRKVFVGMRALKAHIPVCEAIKGGSPTRPTAKSMAEHRARASMLLRSLGESGDGASGAKKAEESPLRRMLPLKYENLAKQFAALETVLTHEQIRTRVSPWLTVKKKTESVSKRTLTMDQLAQIVHIYPEVFDLKYASTHSHLTIGAPKLMVTMRPVSNVAAVAGGKRHRDIFRHRLTELTLKHYKDFLQGRDDIPSNVDPLAARVWHSDFRLEDVPDIPQGDLPGRPRVNKISAVDRLDQQRMASLPPSVQQALQKVQDAKRKPTTEQEANEREKLASELNAKLPKGLQGMSSALLAKIQANAAAKKAVLAETMREPVVKVQAYSKLPRLVDQIRQILKAEKKTVMYLPDLVRKLQSGSAIVSVSREEIIAGIELLFHVVPEWCSKQKMPKGTLFKLSAMPYHEVSQLLQSKIADATQNLIQQPATAAKKPGRLR